VGISNLEEESLIVLLQQKDTEAFEAFYDKYASAIYGLLLSLVKDTDKCSVLLQRVFLKFYQELNSASTFPNGLFVSLYRITIGIVLKTK